MLNQSAEYGLRAVVHLATLPDEEQASASDISERTKVPIPYLQKVLRTLTKTGVLNARRGMGGGFSLAKSSDEITVLEILKAFDSSPQRIEKCPLGIAGHTRLCPLHTLIDDQVANAERVFAKTTIRHILDTQSDIRPLCEEQARVSLGLPGDKKSG
ncbi:MAG: Rrf2 family transcriptional regulator [Phycisphaerales bacterium JB047]